MAAMPRLTDAHSANTTYCRPVCRVRTPPARNCRFFDNAPSAEAAGFRPCMRCRPELAPGLSLVDSSQALAEHAARQIDSAVQQGRDLYIPEVATRMRVTDRHLRRAFQAAHGVTPLGYLSTRRLLLARQLLTDTALPVNEIAHASGFASLRRFNAAFQTHYRMSPTGLRRERAPATTSCCVWATARPMKWPACTGATLTARRNLSKVLRRACQCARCST